MVRSLVERILLFDACPQSRRCLVIARVSDSNGHWFDEAEVLDAVMADVIKQRNSCFESRRLQRARCAWREVPGDKRAGDLCAAG